MRRPPCLSVGLAAAFWAALGLAPAARAAEPATPGLVPTTVPGADAEPAPAAAADDDDDVLTIAACDRERLRLPAQTEDALEATLLVRTERGAGSAVVISPDGFALTAAHVVAGGGAIAVRTVDGTEGTAEVVRLDRAQDIALLKIDLVSPCLVLSDDVASIGSDAFVLGSPGGEMLSFSVAKGIVSGRREAEGLRFLQLDASVNPGNSGGPVVDEEGTIVGITSWKVADVAVEGLAFAVPADTARTALKIELGAATDVDWASFGGIMGDSLPAAATAPGDGAVSLDVRRRLKLRRGLLAAGVGSMIGGVMLVTVAGSIRAGAADYTARHFEPISRTYTAGWVFTGLGAVAIVGGVLVRRTPRRRGATENAAAVALVPTGRGASVVGRF